MLKVIKTGKSKEEVSKNDLEVSRIVADVIKDIETSGDGEVRAYSEKFDQWSPVSFRLSEEEISEIVSKVPQQVIHDIQFAQKNIPEFAEAQLVSLNDIEVENIPGVILGHKNIPMNSVGCYIPGGRYPMVASAHMLRSS